MYITESNLTVSSFIYELSHRMDRRCFPAGFFQENGPTELLNEPNFPTVGRLPRGLFHARPIINEYFTPS